MTMEPPPTGSSDPSTSAAPVQGDQSAGYDPTAYSSSHVPASHAPDSTTHIPSSSGADRGYARPSHDSSDGVSLKDSQHPDNTTPYPADGGQGPVQQSHQQQAEETYQPHPEQQQQASGAGLSADVPAAHAGYTAPQQHQPQPDGASYKVFCGGLSFQTDEDKLRDYFSRIGTVVDVVIMRDRMSGHPRGFGFVSFAEEAVAHDVASRRHDIDGRQVEAKIAIPRNQVPPPSSGGGARGLAMGGGGGMYGGDRGLSGNASGVSRPNTSHLSKIFVGGLPSQVGEAEFSNYFSQFGEVIDAQVMIDHQTGNSRGFGFISFANQAAVEVVVGPGRSSTRHEIMGKTVEVKRAEPKGATPSGGDRRNRDNYGSGVGGMQGSRGHYGGTAPGGLLAGGMANAGGVIPKGAGGGGGVVGVSGSNGAAVAGVRSGAGGGAYNGYNYPASVLEQYGQYYNNPQWQQYYQAMGYNMQQYPQGFNPYTYYAAYMNNASGANTSDSDPRAAQGVPPAGSNEVPGQHHAGNIPGSDPISSYRGAGTGHNGSSANPNGSLGSGTGGGNSRRSSRREDRFHPYR